MEKSTKGIIILYTGLVFLLAGCNRDYSVPETLLQPIMKDITVDEAKILIDTNKDLHILDVRTPAEFSEGHLANAVNIDFYSETFDSAIDSLNHNARFLVYCRSGHRSRNAVLQMQEKQFKFLYNMLGGFNQWTAKGYAVEK